MHNTFLENIDKKRLLGLGIIVLGVLVLGMALISTKKDDKPEEKEETPAQPMVDVPQADIEEVSASKSEAYLKGNEGSKTADIEDYWDACLVSSEEQKDSMATTTAASPAPTSSQRISESDLIAQSAPQRAPTSAEKEYNPYAETHQQREERHQRRQEEAIRLAERMQGIDTTEEQIPEEPAAPQEEPEQPAVITRSGVITSMDSWDESGTLSSLDDVPQQDLPKNERPLRCMFAKACKVSSGQRVPVILLEDIVVSGVLIPRNTHIMATANINDRLELEFASVEKGGRILHLGYEAYDNDGAKGIYCPDVGNTRSNVRRRGSNILTSGLNSRIGRMAGDIVSTGVSIFQDADGKTSVTIPSGYTFLILKKKTY